ncbi:MAG: FAD-dependent oxidoreductase [Gammaproteobacteria bacterium]|nr:MAG: FAD-dependent oxidoreductase [Gammaproteobacteria bacterium]
MTPIIIIGTGFAGYTLAREFRKLDSNTPLLMITSDDGRSYPKPMLSNALTKGKTADELALADANSMAKTLNARIVTNSVVTQINPQQKTIVLSNGEQLNYKQLVLAVGANPIRIPIRGISDNNIISINSLEDYTRFRNELESTKHVALIGPGLIGCEFANDLISAGKEVSVIGPDPYPMSTLLPKAIADELESYLAKAGVNWYLGTTVAEINHKEQSYKITLANGENVRADLLVSAIGLRPNIDLAKKADLEIARGIKTDNGLQTSQENIFALGDCAEVAGHSLLFIAPILAAAKALAKTLSGTPTTVKYPAMPVAIKTPVYPLVVSSPPHGVIGEWQFELASSGFGIKGLFISNTKDLLGFVLSGDMVAEKQVLAKQLPELLA